MNFIEFTRTIKESVSDEALLKVLRTLALTPRILNLYDDEKFAPIHWTMFKRFSESSKYLIEKGADINIRVLSNNNYGWTPIAYAVATNNLEMVEYLLEKGPNMEIDTFLVEQCNILAIFFGQKDDNIERRFEILFVGHDDYRFFDADQLKNQLKQAELDDLLKTLREEHIIQVKILKLLLDTKGVDVNIRNSNGNMAFISTPGRTYSLSYELFYPPENEKATEQLKPLRDEVYKNDVELFTIMARAGLVLPTIDKRGNIPLERVIDSGNLEMIKLYLLLNQDPNNEDYYRNNLANYALHIKFVYIYEYLKSFDRSLKFEAMRSIFSNGVDISLIPDTLKNF